MDLGFSSYERNFHEGLNRYLQEYTGYICMNLQEITGVSRKLQEITGVFSLQLKFTGDYRNTGGLGGLNDHRGTVHLGGRTSAKDGEGGGMLRMKIVVGSGR